MQAKHNPFLTEAPYRKAFLWNMLGSTLNAGSSVLMLMFTTRLAGEVQGGIFSIGFAIASLMWSIAAYETNTFHVTDGRKEFSNENFFHTKLVLCGAAMVFSLVYVLSRGYEASKMAAALLLCLYKIIDAFSGFFYGAFQKANRLDISGRSYFMRVLLALVAFGMGLLFTKQLIVATALSCGVELIWTLGYEVPLGHFLLRYRSPIEWKRVGSILWKCFPLFSASFILMYIINVPKYAIDGMLSEQVQNAFGIIFMPASVINLVGIFIFRPLLTTLVRYWNGGEVKKLVRLCGKCFLLAFGVTLVCVIGAYWVGIPVLELLYGAELSAHRMALVLVMVAGGFYACISFLYNILVVARKQKWILVAYVPTLLFAKLIAAPLVKQYEILGAALVYLLSVMAIFVVLSTIVVAILVQKRKAAA